MRPPSNAELTHHRRLARYRKLFRPFSVDTDTKTAGWEREIDQLDRELFTGLVIDEGESIMRIS